MDFGAGTRNSGLSLTEVDDGNFDYNEKVPVETSQKDGKDIWIRPIGGVVNQDGPFIFSIDAMTDRYLQLAQAGIEIIASVVGQNGETLSPWADVVAPVNLLGVTMWEKVEPILNDQPVSGASTANKGVQAMLEFMLSYDTDAARSHLQSCFFHMDHPFEYGNMAISGKALRRALIRAIKGGFEARPTIPAADQPDPVLAREMPEGYDDVDVLLLPLELDDNDDGRPILAQPPDTAAPEVKAAWGRWNDERNKRLRRRQLYRDHFQESYNTIKALQVQGGDRRINSGFNARFECVSGSHKFDMYSPIVHDFFRLNNHIPPGNKFELKLSMYPNAFILNSYLGTVNRYKLKIHDMKLHLHTIERRERISPPLREVYLMNQTETHKQIVAAGMSTFTFRLHNGGVLPKTVIIAQALQKALDGHYDYNPFNFHHFFITKLALIINGERYPANGLTFDFKQYNPLVTRSYHWMYENTGATAGEKGNLISWHAYQGGAFIVPFDLTPDKCNGLHHHNAEYGYIDLEISWADPLSQPIYIVYEKVSSKVMINDKMTGQVMCLDVET